MICTSSIDSRLYSLRAKGYYENDDILDDSDLVETSSSNAASMNNNIRVRCNGTLHTFQISKVRLIIPVIWWNDLFSLVV